MEIEKLNEGRWTTAPFAEGDDPKMTTTDRCGRKATKFPAPQYEVFAPAGRRFLNGCHSQFAWSIREARETAKEETEPCPEDCDCREEE